MKQNNPGLKTGIGIGIMIGCGASLVMCLLVGGIGVVLAGKSVVGIVTDGPYTIAKRPLPADSTQDTLLPAKVGAYSRGEVTTTGSVFTTVYTNGSNTVTAVAKAFDSVSTAQSNVTAAKTDDNSLTSHLVGSSFDPSYATDNLTKGCATKIFYSRGQYEFAFVGSSASAYDAFMSKFPF